MEHILQKIKEYNKIIITGHVKPDGDCYGSQFGLKNIINMSYPEKVVYLVGGYTEYVSFLGKMDEISDEVFKGALCIVVDSGDSKRIHDQRYILADYIIKIDHHIPVDNYGNYQYVEEESPACCQIITNFYEKFKQELKISLEGATALYTGLITDTGRFRYEGVNGQTLRTAAMLLDMGVNITALDNLLSVETINTLKLKGYVLSNFNITEDGFVYIKITRDIVKQFNVLDEEAANQVGALSSIEGYPVWALIIEYPDGEIRIRLRSRGPDVDKLANQYQGGGHAKASGCKLGAWNDLERFVNDCNQLVKKYKENN